MVAEVKTKKVRKSVETNPGMQVSIGKMHKKNQQLDLNEQVTLYISNNGMNFRVPIRNCEK